MVIQKIQSTCTKSTLNGMIQLDKRAQVPKAMNYPTIEQCVGNTPLVRLQRLGKHLGKNNTLLLKLEGDNPAGSVKDRPALSMISQAERKGLISPGDTLIEATSGNTGALTASLYRSNPKGRPKESGRASLEVE
jgi:threonine synthase